MLVSRGHLCQFASKSVHLFLNYGVYKFGSKLTEGRMDEQAENITTLASLDWRWHKKRKAQRIIGTGTSQLGDEIEDWT